MSKELSGTEYYIVDHFPTYSIVYLCSLNWGWPTGQYVRVPKYFSIRRVSIFGVLGNFRSRAGYTRDCKRREDCTVEYKWRDLGGLDGDELMALKTYDWGDPEYAKTIIDSMWAESRGLCVPKHMLAPEYTLQIVD
jgi:hypothetical protein